MNNNKATVWLHIKTIFTAEPLLKEKRLPVITAIIIHVLNIASAI